jgi:hypothetical protein
LFSFFVFIFISLQPQSSPHGEGEKKFFRTKEEEYRPSHDP